MRADATKISSKNPEFDTYKGATKYLIQTNDLKGIDTTRIENDAEVDGYYAISYSNENMRAVDVLSAYHSLWKIEESFRTMKHFFEMRLIFLWSERRISGHIMLNFIALVLEKHLEIKLSENGSKMSQTSIRDALNGMERSTILADDLVIYMNSKLNENQKLLLDILKISAS